jgi:hypothetical protein
MAKAPHLPVVPLTYRRSGSILDEANMSDFNDPVPAREKGQHKKGRE